MPLEKVTVDGAFVTRIDPGSQLEATHLYESLSTPLKKEFGFRITARRESN